MLKVYLNCLRVFVKIICTDKSKDIGPFMWSKVPISVFSRLVIKRYCIFLFKVVIMTVVMTVMFVM